MHRRRPVPWFASLLGVLLLVACGAAAADEPTPEDEWWKRAGKPPKRRGPAPRSFGIVLGYQNWTGLGDLAWSPSEAAQGELQFDIF